jgi:hypothetical protein
MALKMNYEVNGDFYPGAYLQVKKIVLGSEFTERYEEQADGSLILKYDKRHENVASIFVFPDEEARLNNARPLHHFGIEFPYDVNGDENAYKAAYAALKKVERFKDEIIEDV